MSDWQTIDYFSDASLHEDPYPYLELTSDHLDIAFHPPSVWARPMIVFRDPGMRSRLERLRELGMPLVPGPSGAAAANALLESPDGTALLLLEGEN